MESLARPGRHCTELTALTRDRTPKRPALRKGTTPGLARVGSLAHPGSEVHTAHLTAMEAAAWA